MDLAENPIEFSLSLNLLLILINKVLYERLITFSVRAVLSFFFSLLLICFLYFPAYGIGLLVTFASLYLMAMAQPALLYLVPFTLIPVLVLGLARRELITLWHGDGQVQLFK